MYNFKILN